MKLVASLLVHNELGRYLEPCVEQLLSFCDVVRVLDDGSTDGSCEWLCEKPGVELLAGTPATFFEHEGSTRQELLDWTLDANPTHVLAVDADEFVAAGSALRAAIGASPEQPVWGLEMHEVWQADRELLYSREDGGWRTHAIPCLWRVPDNIDDLRVNDPHWRILDRALACGREPLAVRMTFSRQQWLPAGDVLHFGWLNTESRQSRYDRYAAADGGRFHSSTHLDSILDPDELVVLQPLPWPPSLSPSSVLA